MYRGFEGEPWPDPAHGSTPVLDAGLAPLGHYEQVRQYYGAIPESYNIDLLYLEASCQHAPRIDLPQSFRFLGYDYGFYLSEYNHYSTIFHEVLYGGRHALRRFGALLNEALLLPTCSLVQELHSTCSELVAQGVPLEGPDPFQGIAIWAARKTHSGRQA